MLLSYAPLPPAVRRLGPAACSAVVGVLSGVGSASAFVHAARTSAALANAANTWCGTCATEATAQVRRGAMAPENAMSVGVFLGGLAVVAGVQAIRFYNGSAARRSPGAA